MIRRTLGVLGARRTGSDAAPGSVLPSPAKPVYVIGDIHGRADLLDRLLPRLAADRAARGSQDAATVFVGDYIDRGPDSAGVLARCVALDEDPSVTCLLGNHEAMCLDFLTGTGGEPAAIGWLRNGGRAMLESYGAAQPIRIDGAEPIAEMRAAALARIPGKIVDWLKARPLLWTSGDVAVCHATPDPLIPLAELTPRDSGLGPPETRHARAQRRILAGARPYHRAAGTDRRPADQRRYRRLRDRPAHRRGDCTRRTDPLHRHRLKPPDTA